ncbi:MAG: ggt [Xanthobacteraceae bacterium]|nr:ggt [Xanthobacteraceae bacterium]
MAASPLAAHAQSAPGMESARGGAFPRAVPVAAKHGMVVAQEKHAARIGVLILEQGGNAVDAAVATGFAMAVTYPRAGNIGGCGFMVIHRQDATGAGTATTIDYRETAPSAVTAETFLDAQGNADPAKSRDSALAVGVPGTVAGLAMAHAKYGSGKFTLAQLIAPAIALARNGIAVEDDTADTLPDAKVRLTRWPSSAKIFAHPDGRMLGPGDTLVQRDLADTLTLIAQHGPQAFYDGPVAEKLVWSLRQHGGLMTREDLKSYHAIERAPVRGTYRGHDIVSMGPPSSGGVHLIEMLNILEGLPLASLGAQSPAALHLMISAMQRAYADRATYLGDPDRVAMPLERLMSKDYAASLRALIDPQRARPSADIQPRLAIPREGQNTTHYSVVDRDGNAVSNTYTLNFGYGLGLVADGTGILLNNELDDFAAKPGAPNAFGLVGGAANAPGPGKRPLSSMTPTIVLKDGKPFLVLGSPGGSRIITAVVQVTVNVIDHDMNVADAVTAPRVHHQWLPDQVLAERGLSAETVKALEALGHKVVVGRPGTAVNAIARGPQGWVGAADTRTRGAEAVGE